MQRRQFLLCAGCLLFGPLSHAQPAARTPVVAYFVQANVEPGLGHFKEGLLKLGYVDGKNIQIIVRTADGKAERLSGLAAELVRLKVDIVVAWSTPVVTAAKQATSQIPIVMVGSGDPVGTGLIASLARPGGNITGTAGNTAELGGKLLELTREVLPSAKRVAVLANATDPFTKLFLEQIQTAGRTMALEISPIMIRESGELDAAFAGLIKRRTDIVIVQPSLPRRLAAEMALKRRFPAVSPIGSFPDDGGLMSYAVYTGDLHREAAVYVDKILKGAKPADLPVQQPTKFELVVNLKTAKAIGITIPKSILFRADRVIK